VEPLLGHRPDIRLELRDGSVVYLEVHVFTSGLVPMGDLSEEVHERWGTAPDAQLREAWGVRLAQYRAVDPAVVPWGSWPFRLLPAVSSSLSGGHPSFVR